jgi:hypothetical protein
MQYERSPGEEAICQSRVRLAVVLKSEVITSVVPGPFGDLLVRGTLAVHVRVTELW